MEQLKAVLNLPEQMKEAMKLKLPELQKKIKKIVIAGMGGSAIGGEILSNWAMDKTKIPIFINRDYSLPKFVDRETLILAVSYSGNTEETISSFFDGMRYGNVIGISSGGILEKLCKKNVCPHIKLPCGYQPRAAIGYMLVPELLLLEKISIFSAKKEIEDAIQLLFNERKNAKKIAMKISKQIYNSYPVIYAYSPYLPIAKRWRTQLNENAKILARDDAFPEMNHNDIVGWSGSDVSNFSAILLRDRDENERIRKRIEITKEIGFKGAKSIIDVWAKGKSSLSKLIYLLFIGDLTSVYLGLLRGVDTTKVEVIERLKKEMRKKHT
ncbi:MAG: bifunctional phosphoglucose/phosphomannose isomerase, partial [Candidatus Thermoplasmatota archaeon]